MCSAIGVACVVRRSVAFAALFASSRAFAGAPFAALSHLRATLPARAPAYRTDRTAAVARRFIPAVRRAIDDFFLLRPVVVLLLRPVERDLPRPLLVVRRFVLARLPPPRFFAIGISLSEVRC